jgi:3-deoxy-7-phosphoheptulonate synthase
VLRGGTAGPNYDTEHVAAAAAHLDHAGVCPRVLIDASHGNSEKDYKNQPHVLRDVCRQLKNGSPHVLGVMIESNLVAGNQKLGPGTLTYGQSITDGCVDMSTTEAMLEELAGSVALGVRETA